MDSTMDESSLWNLITVMLYTPYLRIEACKIERLKAALGLGMHQIKDFTIIS